MTPSRILSLLAAGAIGVGLTAAPVPAVASSPSSVVVELTTVQGVPLSLADSPVVLSSADGDYEESGETDASGRVTFDDVPTGERLYATVYETDYVARTVGVLPRDGRTVRVAYPLALGATITGTLAESDASDCVLVSALDRAGDSFGSSSQVCPGESYRISGLPSGKYRVQFMPFTLAGAGASAWGYAGGASWADATVFAVRQQSASRAESRATGADGALAPAATLALSVPADLGGHTVHLVHLASNGRALPESLDVFDLDAPAADLLVQPGRYRVAVSFDGDDDEVTYFYAGVGRASVVRESRAAVVTVPAGGASISLGSVRFIPQP